MIRHVLMIFAILLFDKANGLRSSGKIHQAVEKSKTQEQITKIKQLNTLLQDPDVSSLLKMNVQVYESKNLGILQNSFSQQEITLIKESQKLLDQWDSCPQKMPYFDGLSCVQCPKEEIFDLITQKCARCRSGSIYDKKKKDCVSRSSKFNIALTQMDLERAQQIIIIQANQIAANLMSFVFEKTQRLKERLEFDQEMSQNKTTLIPNATNPHFLNLIILGEDQKIEQFKAGKEDITCPKQKPFYATDKCINCNYPTHLFDAKTKWCVKCSNNFVYSVTIHKCVKLRQKTQNTLH